MISGTFRVMYERVKPMMFSICFITAFNIICVTLFIREDHLNLLFALFKYWWYVLYLIIAIGIFYLFYRMIRNKKAFALFLFLLSVGMGVAHYYLSVKGFFIFEFTFPARTLGCMAFGMLVSYLPDLKSKRFNPSILFVIALVPAIFNLAYNDKSYLTCLGMIAMFAALVYFTYNLPIGGKFFDIIGQHRPGSLCFG